MDAFELIEAYLAGDLAPQVRQSVEERIENDPQFAEEFRLQQDTHRLLALDRQRAYKTQLQTLDAELSLSNPQPVSRPLWNQTWFKVAAAVVLLLVPAWFFLQLQTESPSLFEESFQPYPDRVNLRSEGVPVDSLLQDAMLAYDVENYPAAILYFRQILKQNPQHPHAGFYLGISLLANEQADEAVATLQEISPESPYSEATQWYLALAHLAAQDEASAKAQLERIQQDANNSYAERAGALLKDLK